MEQRKLPAVVDYEGALAAERAEREARIEREQVEWVFGLTGGELNDKSWRPFVARDLSGAPEAFRYSYGGAPYYDEDHRERDGDFVTVVSIGEEPERLYEKGARYARVASFTSSGEAACPIAEEAEAEGHCEGHWTDRPCPLCEAQEDEKHGYIYLGAGWTETVYQRIATCPDCDTDLASHCDYGDDRCLACGLEENDET